MSKVLSKEKEALSKVLSKEKNARAVNPSGSGSKARSSSEFERSVEKAAPVRCFRVLSRQVSRKSCACAVFSSAVEAVQLKKLRLCGVFECCRGSSVEKAAPVQCFRVLSRQLSRKSCACAVFSSAVEAAQSKKLRLCGVFECGRASLEFSAREWSGEFTI